ncbi:thioredoxin family protein [Neobacillus rhizophilus]|uniref:Thioredoxin family protein n=1 Tax=Neobacillus rhizophilus TaxID=2833579 RepID=A0A942U6F5_9BACI|nr:thioredoxin family protein [Neobacillus rhizophilus]MBS4213332.1 thioredoxin family protein [Neobacillus rhizophilus]
MLEWNRNEFSAFWESGERGVVYFYTPMCGTCQVAGKMLMVVEAALGDFSVGKMNLNYYPDLAESFAIESVPCLLFVEGGRVAETLYAFHSVPYLLEKIKGYLRG